MADVQVAYRFVQAVRRRRNEILGSQTLPFSSFPLLVRLPVENPSAVMGVSAYSTDTTALVSTTPFTYYSFGSTGLLDQSTTQSHPPALPVASTSLATTNLQYGSQFSSLPTQTSAPSHLPSKHITITLADAIPFAPLADSGPQEIIRSIDSSTEIAKSPPQVTMETVLQEVVTLSLSASGSDSNANNGPTSISAFSATLILNDTGSTSHATAVGRPAAKAVGNAFSTSGTPSSTPAVSSPLYPQQGHPLGLNPVAVVGCVLAGILSLTVVSFCILWAFRSRRRLRDDNTAIL